jgi:DNA-binding protein HU-beta
MTKKELLKQIEDLANSNGADVSGKQTEKVFNAVIECVRKQTVAEGKLAIADLGSFVVRTRAARKGHNPKTGEAINIPESKSVGFKPAKTFKELMK